MFYVDGGEYFHGLAQAAEDPLHAGLGLAASAKSNTPVSSPGDRCPEGAPAPRLRLCIRAESRRGSQACPWLQNKALGTLVISGSLQQHGSCQKTPLAEMSCSVDGPSLVVESEPRCDLSQVSLTAAPLFYVLSPRRRENQACRITDLRLLSILKHWAWSCGGIWGSVPYCWWRVCLDV